MPRVFVSTSEDKRDIHQIRSDKKASTLYSSQPCLIVKMLGHLIRDCFANSFESRKKPRSGLADLSHFEDTYRIRSPFFALPWISRKSTFLGRDPAKGRTASWDLKGAQFSYRAFSCTRKARQAISQTLGGILLGCLFAKSEKEKNSRTEQPRLS